MSTSLCDLQYPLCMIAGASLQRGFRFKDEAGDLIDITGYHAAIHVREKAGSAESIIELDSDAPTDAGSTLLVDGAEGTIFMDITPEETESFVTIQKDRRLVWDLRVTDAEGKVTVYFRASIFTIRPVSTRELPEVVVGP